MDAFFYIIIGMLVIFLLMMVRTFRLVQSANKTIQHQKENLKSKEKDLSELNRRFEELENEKKQIISIVSHDIKAPFNRVFALTNLLNMEKDELSDSQQDYVNKIQTSVTDGLSLIRHLLDIRAIEERGGIDLRIQPLSVGKMMDSTVKSNQIIAKKKDLTLYYSDQTDGLYIDMDKQYFDRIFDNILSNAIKYTPIGGSINVLLVDTEDSLTASISDDGPGILKSEEDRLFEKYEVLSSKATGGETDNGLALYITKALIERLGGQIWQETNSGEGATFFVKMMKEVPEELKN